MTKKAKTWIEAPNLAIGATNLHRVCWLRAILIASETLALLFSQYYLQPLSSLAIPPTGPLLLLTTNILVTLITLWRLQALPHPVRNTEFFGQLMFDVLSHSLLLYFTGGYTNPLVSVYLIPITIGAALLPPRFSWGLTLSSIVAYTLLMNWYQPAEAHINHEMPGDHQQAIALHLAGMWGTFVLSALLINVFIVLMANTVRQQQAAIAQARERQLRDENILGIALQAAGAAHELGTPLATMAVILGDLLEEQEGEQGGSAALVDDLALLRNQVEECKKRLNQVVADSQHTQIETIAVSHFMSQVLSQWQLLRPESNLQYATPSWSHSTGIRCDTSLYQAVIALLDNAENASPGLVRLSVGMDAQQVFLKIIDQGGGLPTTIITEQMGTLLSDEDLGDVDPTVFKKAIKKTRSSHFTPLKARASHEKKNQGLGVGLLLSQASIERLGGQVRLYRLTRGTLTEISLPVTAIQKS